VHHIDDPHETEHERQSRREQKQNHRERNAIEDVDDPERHVCLPIELPMVRDVGSPNRRISAATAGRRNGEKSQDGIKLRNDGEDHRLDSAST
jgi:hypothetical protein